jgi:tagatose-6-phosphate ketose/aldose isomerase
MFDLGYDVATLEEAQGAWTAREIAQQPACLRETAATLSANAYALPLLSDPAARVVLTGAGSSAFIGEAAAPLLNAALPCRVEAVATTDLVAAPQLYLERGTRTLMVSFARSGNSPESVAAVTLAERLVSDIRHLAITCNPQGELVNALGEVWAGQVLSLPEATHDRGFAMTSSFSAMLFAALSTLGGFTRPGAGANSVAPMVEAALTDHCAAARSLASELVQRVVFLGSGAFKGLAREAALKLLELTDGRKAAIHDTPLGFRHGPKTFVDPATLVVVFLSADPYTRRYDVDLVNELRADGRARRVLALSATPDPRLTPGGDVLFAAPAGASDAELLFPYLAFAQMYAFHSSLALGLTPDNPNPAGLVNRVVQGVRIHPFRGGGR